MLLESLYTKQLIILILTQHHQMLRLFSVFESWNYRKVSWVAKETSDLAAEILKFLLRSLQKMWPRRFQHVLKMMKEPIPQRAHFSHLKM